jgi:hypothetical protein
MALVTRFRVSSGGLAAQREGGLVPFSSLVLGWA